MYVTRRGRVGPGWLVVCLGFTGGAPAWADEAQPHRRPEIEAHLRDPRHAPTADRSAADVIAALDAAQGLAAAPSQPGAADRAGRSRSGRPALVGATARLGTTVGHVQALPIDVLSLGVTVAAGYRFGPFLVEAEYARLRHSSHDAEAHFPVIGGAHRLAAQARADVWATAPGRLGRNTQLVAYAEVGAARQADDWHRPGRRDGERLIPADAVRHEALVGFGVRLDVGTRYPLGLPAKLAWQLGWRLASAPRREVPMVLCRGDATCAPAPPSAPAQTGTSLLFGSGLEASW